MLDLLALLFLLLLQCHQCLLLDPYEEKNIKTNIKTNIKKQKKNKKKTTTTKTKKQTKNNNNKTKTPCLNI